MLIFFNYIPELNDFLLWAQQLFAESLGKNQKGFILKMEPPSYLSSKRFKKNNSKKKKYFGA